MNVIMTMVYAEYHLAECHYDNVFYAEGHFAECHHDNGLC
jgi:hypothetical protein